MRFTSSDDLRRVESLAVDDEVVFKTPGGSVFTYSPYPDATHMELVGGYCGSNHLIFEALGLQGDKHSLARGFGKSSGFGAWPSFVTGDFTALRNLCLHLMEMCEGKRTVSPKLSLDEIKRGSVVKGCDDRIRRVLLRIEDCVLLSPSTNIEHAGTWYTIRELRHDGFTVVSL